MTPPALSSLIDIFSFYSRYSQVVGDKPTNSRADGKEWHGSCPSCGGSDRFTFWESGRYSCSLRSSGCGLHGSSPYWFLRDVEGLNHSQACDELGIDPDAAFEKSEVKLPLFMTKDEEPCKKWQDAAEAFCWRAERYLWTHYTAQVDYLHSRGLDDDTIRTARLGYCPGWYTDDLENWGLTPIQTQQEQEIKIPGGLVIPWFVDGRIWKLSIRRPEQGYFQVLGSSDALYNIDSLQPGQPCVLVESEIDALSVQQEASHLTAAIATGGASKGLSARWISRILQASHVLISFDQDEAGEQGAEEWAEIIPNSMRWIPFAKDCNAMLQEDIWISPWVVLGFNLLLYPPQQTQPELPLQPQREPVQAPPALVVSPQPIQKPRLTWEHVNERGLPLNCSCRLPATYWGTACQGYCEKCRPAKQWYQNL